MKNFKQTCFKYIHNTHQRFVVPLQNFHTHTHTHTHNLRAQQNNMYLLSSALLTPGVGFVPHNNHLHRRIGRINRCHAKAGATLIISNVSSSTKVEEAVRGNVFIEKALVECAENVPEITWSSEQVKEELGKDISRVFIAVEEEEEEEEEEIIKQLSNKKVLGFIVCWFVAGETQILELAVRSDQRRKGIARQLLDAVVKAAPGNELHLEVSESNEAAIALYEKYGFVSPSPKMVRKKYYKDGSGAVLMSMNSNSSRSSGDSDSSDTQKEGKEEEVVSTRELVRLLAGLPEELAKIPAPLDPNDRSDVDGDSSTEYLKTEAPKREIPFERNRGGNDFSYRRSKRRNSLLDG